MRDREVILHISLLAETWKLISLHNIAIRELHPRYSALNNAEWNAYANFAFSSSPKVTNIHKFIVMQIVCDIFRFSVEYPSQFRKTTEAFLTLGSVIEKSAKASVYLAEIARLIEYNQGRLITGCKTVPVEQYLLAEPNEET